MKALDALARAGDREPALYRARLTARWSSRRQGYEVVRLEVEPGWREQPITMAGLRTMRIEEILQGSQQLMARTDQGSTIPFLVPGAGWNELPEDERLLLAARTYVLARAFARPPLKAVADTFRISQSTATRLIARARAEGLVASAADDGGE